MHVSELPGLGEVSSHMDGRKEALSESLPPVDCVRGVFVYSECHTCHT